MSHMMVYPRRNARFLDAVLVSLDVVHRALSHLAFFLVLVSFSY